MSYCEIRDYVLELGRQAILVIDEVNHFLDDSVLYLDVFNLSLLIQLDH